MGRIPYHRGDFTEETPDPSRANCSRCNWCPECYIAFYTSNFQSTPQFKVNARGERLFPQSWRGHSAIESRILFEGLDRSKKEG